MMMNELAAMVRLSSEYLSKVKCCDECFCEYWCLEHGVKQSRVPHRKCERNIVEYLQEYYREKGFGKPDIYHTI